MKLKSDVFFNILLAIH